MRRRISTIWLCPADSEVLVADTRSECPNAAAHTPSPASYLGWHDWAQRMSRTHHQIRCTGCGRFSIWVPKVARADPERAS